MKAGLTTSAILHVAVLGFGLLSLSAPAPLEVADVEALPVDIVPIEEITQIQQGEKKAPLDEQSAPQPTERPETVADAQTVGENTVDTPEPPTPEPSPRPVPVRSAPPPEPKPAETPRPVEEKVAEAAPAPVPATERAAEPTPSQPVLPAPTPVPRPEPVTEAPAQPPAPPEPPKVAEAEPEPAKVAEATPEPVTPDAIAEAIAAEPQEPAEEPAKPVAETPPATEPAQDAVSLPSSAPAPAARPSPPQAQTAKAPERKEAEKPAQQAASRPSSNEKQFNSDEISALLDKQKPSGGGAKRSQQQAALGGERTTGGSTLSQSEMDALRGQVQRCWNIPAGALDGERLRVSVKFRLDRSGALEGSPEIISGGGSAGVERAAAEAARRAVSRCSPYNLPAEKYEAWADVIVNFDPSEMF